MISMCFRPPSGNEFKNPTPTTAVVANVALGFRPPSGNEFKNSLAS